MKKLLSILIITLLMGGCVKETDWLLPSQVHDLIIVESIITNETKVQTLRLSLPVAELNQAPEPLTGAVVIINDEDSAWQLTELPGNSGNYQTLIPFSAQAGKHYTLFVSWQDKILTAKAGLIPGLDFQRLKYALDGSTGLYQITWVAPAYSSGQAAMYEVLLDWSAVPGYQQMDSTQTHARLLYYTLPTLDVSEIFAPIKEKINFPAGTKVIERRYSLTEEHAWYLRSLLLETQWQGGLFPAAAANVSTNISPGGAGFFGCCAVTKQNFTVK